MSIEVFNISKSFGSFKALKDISLKVPTGELVALLGPSGSGKTTLLRIIAGLETPDAGSGSILFHNESVEGRRAGERGIGFVFQHYALFRHMTVFENIAFGLRVRPRRLRPSRSDIRERVNKLLRLVQLENQSNRYPSQLSGGQRQRVALARALAVEPQVLLLDEPFGSLDAKVRSELRQWLRRLHDEIHLTSVFVTHDQEEALEVADRVVVMNDGRVEQVGSPEQVFHKPSSEFVINFLGAVNLFHGRIENGKTYIGQVEIETNSEHEQTSAAAARIFVRPHHIDIHSENTGAGCIQGTVDRINSAGPTVKVEIISEFGDLVRVELTQERFRELQLTRGSQVYVTPQQATVFVMDEEYAI